MTVTYFSRYKGETLLLNFAILRGTSDSENLGVNRINSVTTRSAKLVATKFDQSNDKK